MTLVMLDKILSYASSFGTFVSAVAALYAIWLTIFQRRISYRPNIIIRDVLINSKKDKFDGFDLDENTALIGVKVELNNIGLGTAISVKYSWEYEFEKELKKYDALFFEKFNKKDDSFDFDYNNGLISFKKERSGYFYPGLNIVRDIDFILPHNISKESTMLEIPYAALLLLTNISYLIILNRHNFNKTVHGPKLIVVFQDIEGNTIRNEWTSKLQIGHSSFSSDNDVKTSYSLRFSPTSMGSSLRRLQKIRKSYTDFMNEHNFNKNK
ncbi:hypothetical protein [Enterobacter hormaechei]|uniref:hypothetical protein n=2 Tax=Enterobacter hormaechei TaxID=158836 RepID=UPI000A55BF0D|nr:hypothetical protein [Enterobacter hormaechei]ELC6492738.1 hypothetical protein [Enterobacter hormaechei]MCU4095210.1 hypothetical protein [Enterobacter hormaechei subsp. steigerwaltii]